MFNDTVQNMILKLLHSTYLLSLTNIVVNHITIFICVSLTLCGINNIFVVVDIMTDITMVLYPVLCYINNDNQYIQSQLYNNASVTDVSVI